MPVRAVLLLRPTPRQALQALGVVVLLGLPWWDVSGRPWHVVLPRDPASALRRLVLLLWTITLPALAGAIYLHYRDRLHEESWRLIGKLFVWGALVGSVAGLGEHLYSLGMAHSPWAGTRAESFLQMVFVVAVLEEGVKFSAAWFLTYRSPLFKQVYDGVLFCAAAALGFATLENIFYVFTGGDDALGIAVARAVVPLHVVFGIVMGYGMGRARAVSGTPKETEWLTLGFVGAVTLHGVWNFLIGFRSAVTLLNLPLLIAAWIGAFRAIRRALSFSPFVRCTRCRHVIPRVSAYCPFCRKRRRIYLKCRCCGGMSLLRTRFCPQCHTRLTPPWHLRAGRVSSLYPRIELTACTACRAPLPPGSRFCSGCGSATQSRMQGSWRGPTERLTICP